MNLTNVIISSTLNRPKKDNYKGEEMHDDTVDKLLQNSLFKNSKTAPFSIHGYYLPSILIKTQVPPYFPKTSISLSVL